MAYKMSQEFPNFRPPLWILPFKIQVHNLYNKTIFVRMHGKYY